MHDDHDHDDDDATQDPDGHDPESDQEAEDLLAELDAMADPIDETYLLDEDAVHERDTSGESQHDAEPAPVEHEDRFVTEGQDPLDPKPPPTDNTVIEVRCKTCRLPPDLTAMTHAWYFEQDLSTARVAFLLNAELERRGLTTRILARSLRTHLSKHATHADRVAYALHAPKRGGREAPLLGEALALLRDATFRSRHDEVAHVATSMAEAFEELQADLQTARSETTVQQRLKDYSNLARVGKSVLAAAETCRRQADPRRVGMVVRDVIIDACLEEFLTKLREVLDQIKDRIVREVPVERQHHLNKEVGDLLDAMSKSLGKLIEDYREQVEITLAEPGTAEA